MPAAEGRSRLLYCTTVGSLRRVLALQPQVGLEVADALDVVLQPLVLAVDHHHDAVHVAQHQAPHAIVRDLAGHRAQVHAHRVPLEVPELHRQQIEEQRALGGVVQA